MKISTFIKVLEKIKDKNGDISIAFDGDDFHVKNGISSGVQRYHDFLYKIVDKTESCIGKCLILTPDYHKGKGSFVSYDKLYKKAIVDRIDENNKFRL